MGGAWRVRREIVILGTLLAIGCKGESITDRDPDSVFGIVRIQVKTFGVDLDANGYMLDVRGIEQHNVPASGEVDVRVLAGPARLTLTGVAANCHIAGPPDRTVTIAPGTSAVAKFVVTCGGGAQHVAYAGLVNGQMDIFVLPEGSSTPVHVTNSPGRDSDPVWSPRGDRLAFASLSSDSATTLIHVVSSTGDTLTTLGSPNTNSVYPAWSPSDDRIVFASNVSGNYELYTVNMDGSGLVRLTSTDENELRPAWSPDGMQIVYDVDVADQSVERDLGIMNADGSGAVRFATGGRYNFHAAWSPDGQWIAFATQRHGAEEVYAARVDGSELVRITNHGARDGSPAWAADGTTIIFESQRTGTMRLHKRTLDNAQVQSVTPGAHAIDPAISR
jgi:TolB protein